tara:strand:+ start:551 stop:682 length:132 start_codon:yes stop_codon:yes gene_type:complete
MNRKDLKEWAILFAIAAGLLLLLVGCGVFAVIKFMAYWKIATM